MKTLTMNNVTYEIVDEYARNNVDEIEKALAEKQPVGDYALKSEIPTDYLTEIPSEYVTETELNAKGYLTEHQSLDGLATEGYVNTQIAAIPTPDVSGQINTHNTATNAHNDIRLLIEGLTTRLNTLADSDDTTLDQMSEIVEYIKNNKTLIENVTTNKVNVSDIINNLTTNVTNKPLSAAQGVALKALIDALDTDKLDVSSLTSAINTALAQAKASGEFDGKDGTNGVSATHSWNGTTLTITSASGSSSANLKGSDGVGVSKVQQTTTSTADDGNNVITVTLSNGTTSTFTVQNGSKGSKGDSPVRGTDYWTDADKAEIKSYVDEAILGGAW
jgi:predicted DNA-binding ArsR family transcriptional regulator